MAKEANKANKEKKDKKENKSFLKEFKAELKRVNWPTFKQLVNNTTAVLTIVLITAVIVFVLDVIFENLNNYGIEGLKTLVSANTQELDEEMPDNQIDSGEVEPIESEEQNSDVEEVNNSTDEVNEDIQE